MMRVCATCDILVPDTAEDSHSHEWLCSNDACGRWFHVGGNERCPHCGAPGMK